jgi:hypothetical protein
VAELRGARRIWVKDKTLFVLTIAPAIEAHSCARLLNGDASTLSVPTIARPSPRQADAYIHGIPFGDTRIMLASPKGRGSAPIVTFPPPRQAAWWRAHRLAAWDEVRFFTIRGRRITATSRATMREQWAADCSAAYPRAIAEGGRLLFSDSETTVRCVDAATGRPHWQYAASGPDSVVRPLVVDGQRAYVAVESRGTYDIAVLDAATGGVLQTASPQPGDDLLFHLYSLTRSADGLRWYAEQSGHGAGVLVPAVLALDSSLRLLWKRAVFSFTEADGSLVCVAGLGNNNESWLPPPQRYLLSLGPDGRERWRRRLSGLSGVIGTWRGAALAVSGPRRAKGPLVLHGIRPGDGRTLWSTTVRAPR